MKTINIIALCFSFLAILVTIATVKPSVLAANLAEYGSSLSTLLPYLLYLITPLLAFGVSRLALRFILYVVSGIKARMIMFVDERITLAEQTPSDMSSAAIVATIVRNPSMIDTLAGHMGIGTATAGSESIKVRVDQSQDRIDRLEAKTDHLYEQSTRLRDLEKFVADTAFKRVDLIDQVKRMLDLNQRYFAARTNYPELSRELKAIWEEWDWSSQSWDQWELAKTEWEMSLQRWVSLFPFFEQFDDVHGVMNVNSDDIRAAINDWAKHSNLSDAQQHEYREFAAVRLKFIRTGWHAVLMLGELIEAPISV